MTEELVHSDGDTDDEVMVEIDWQAIEEAVAAFRHAGLDFDDHEMVLNHFAVMLGSLLAKMRDGGMEEDQLGQLAAEVAAFAVDLACGDDELPTLEVSDEDAGDEDQDTE